MPVPLLTRNAVRHVLKRVPGLALMPRSKAAPSGLTRQKVAVATTKKLKMLLQFPVASTKHGSASGMQVRLSD